jgi:hypothetical protein
VNGAFGGQIIPILCAYGASALALCTARCTAFEYAMMTSKAMADAMVPFLPVGFVQRQKMMCFSDPVGSLVCAVEHGVVLPRPFSRHYQDDTKIVCAQFWGDLRAGTPCLLDDSEDDALRSMLRSNDAKLWKWASSEPQMQQHPITGETIFHLLCRTEALDVQAKLAV